MKKTILIQTPAKFYDVAKIFCIEMFKFGFYDKIYVASNAEYVDFHPNVVPIKLDKDHQFSSNMLHAIDEVEEDIFFVCCEDHVIKAGNRIKDWQRCFDFIESRKDVGFLRMTHHDNVKIGSIIQGTKPSIGKLDSKYKYYISLQPAWWRKDYFRTALTAGEDAWKFEVTGAKRCRKIKSMSSFCVGETVFHHTNFLKSGEFYRRQYVDYAMKHNIDITEKRKVYHNKKPIEYTKYIEQKKNV